MIPSKQDPAFAVSTDSPPMPPQSLHFPLLRVYLGHPNIQPRQTVHSPGYAARQESGPKSFDSVAFVETDARNQFLGRRRTDSMSRKRLGHVFKEEDEAVDPWAPAKMTSDEDKEESDALENIESFPVDWTSFATSSIRESIDQDINSSFDTLRAEDSSALTNDLGKDKTIKFMLI